MEIDQSYKPVLVKMVILLTIAWAIVVGGEASADPRFGGYEAVRVYLDEETSLVGWLDIKQLPADAMLQFATEKLGARIPVESAREIVALHELLRNAGVERIYFVGRAPLEIMTQGPLMVIPANSPESLDVSMASRIPPTISRRVDRGCVLLGQPQTLERAVLHPNRPRTELEAAIKDVGDAHGAAFVPTPFLRDSLNILAGASAKDPTMKVRLDAISGITSLVGRVKFPPEDLSIEATFDEALQANLVGDLVRDQMVAELGSDISPYLPVIVDRRIKLEAKSREQVENLLQKLAAPMRRSSDLAMEMNSMKQIALALHNYESATGSFPPQALVDGKGQRLLSWRVLILPYLEQDSLYRQFHLDEPWDSEHNRSLISKMPAVFRRSAAVNASEEKTPFLVPLAGNSIFGRPGRPARIRDVTDGTSQTIWLLRMPDEDAVVWTKPDDWVVPKEDPLKRFRESAEKLMVGRADGSVQILSSSLKPETVHALFSMDGAEPIHPSDLE